ncbi:Alpha-1,2 glucosyltransferase/transcriptional activator [Phaffia rhodozyma]|uniref:Dol-P-Glc:Glc(2)Man(9)GlcNAc(2)-PP-Dol alpha-1,2-glucosyltransferase n=1 Tax=Phaffia rhodozyma TaxID=264483 RepID=A0A0F7SLL0_PHARH|nr:Alpha-1,2 glucosyltransferase/transcriptional activator [Phaffia rhodozyma]
MGSVSSPYVLYATFTILAFALVQVELPDPYMDEIFHVPQAQRYCTGDYFTWDPKLTTPPGLYILSVIPAKVFHISCTTEYLRGTNLVLSLLLPAIIRFVLSTFPPRTSSTSTSLQVSSSANTLESVSIALFPATWFFGNLYYTDLGSLVLVLLSWGMARKERFWVSSLVGLLSLAFRQTNVIWMIFIFAVSVLHELDVVQDLERSRAMTINGRTRRQAEKERDELTIGEILSETIKIPSRLLTSWKELMPVAVPYIPTLIAFGAFIRWNGGIVLGHKEMHEATLHFPQLGYFLAFATLLGWPILLDRGVTELLKRAIKDGFGGIRQALTTSVLTRVTMLAIKHTTIVHPFLLADNRHYAFYVWRRVINPFPAARFLLGVGYVGCAIIWAGRLFRTQPPLTVLGLFTATLLTLTPSPLIEPRYFLIPFTILRILASPSPLPSVSAASESKPVDGVASTTVSTSTSTKRTAKLDADDKKRRIIIVELLSYTFINILTLTVFLTVKFKWDSEPGEEYIGVV